MTTKFKKFNGRNFSLWKLKIMTGLWKDNFLNSIDGTHADITDEKWKDMDGDVASNLHLAMPYSVLSSIAKKKTIKEI